MSLIFYLLDTARIPFRPMQCPNKHNTIPVMQKDQNENKLEASQDIDRL